MDVQSPLAGFANTDCFQLIWPDTLHQSAKGDIEKLLSMLTEKLDDSVIEGINEQLAAIPVFPGYHPPSQGLSTPKMWASQQAAMFACMPVALLHLEDEFLAAMRVVIVGEHFVCLSRCHTTHCPQPWTPQHCAAV